MTGITAEPAREGSVVLADGRRLAFAEWGDPDGTPVLLLHGSPGSSHLCPDEAATLAAGVRLIAPDRPGYGRSDRQPGRTIPSVADDLAALIREQAGGPVSVVGWSGGGPYALALAVRHPELVRSVAVIASPGPLDLVPDALDGFPPEVRELLAAVRRDRTANEPAVRARCAWYGERPERPMDDRIPGNPDNALLARPAVEGAMRAMFRHGALQGADGFVDDWIAGFGGPWGLDLADVRIPTTVHWGDGDLLTDRAHTMFLAGAIPSARLTVYPGEGHLAPLAHWAEILDDLLTAAEA